MRGPPFVALFLVAAATFLLFPLLVELPHSGESWKGLVRRIFDRNRTLASSGDRPFILVPLFGSNADSGVVFVEIGIGRPIQWVRAVADTGSASFTLPCVDTDSATTALHKPHSAFNSSRSTTISTVQCDLQQLSDKKHPKSQAGCTSCDASQRCLFQRSFAEGSKVEGVWLRDQLGFPSYDGPHGVGKAPSSAKTFLAQFGCHTSETGLLSVAQADGADGILGLSQAKLSVMTAVVQAGIVKANRLAVCITQRDHGPFATLQEETHDADDNESTGSLLIGASLYGPRGVKGGRGKGLATNTALLSITGHSAASRSRAAESPSSESPSLLATNSMGWYALGLRGLRMRSRHPLRSTLARNTTTEGEGSSGMHAERSRGGRLLAEPPREVKEAFSGSGDGAPSTKDAVEGDGEGWLSSSVGLNSLLGSRVVLDTGSSYSYLPPEAVDAIIHGIAKACFQDETGYSRLCGYRSLKPSSHPVPRVEGLVIPPGQGEGTKGEENYLPVGQAACYRFLPLDRNGKGSKINSKTGFPAAMPDLQLRFAGSAERGDAVFTIPPSNYLPSVSWTKPLRCLALQSNSHSSGRNLLGLHALAGLEVVVDADVMKAEWTELPSDAVDACEL